MHVKGQINITSCIHLIF